MSDEQLNLPSDLDGTAGKALQTNTLKDGRDDGQCDGHFSQDIMEKIAQDHNRSRQTVSACRCSQDPAFQLYTHFKSLQRLNQQRQSRIAREERKKRKRTNISSNTFSVDSHSGRWLSLDLSSRLQAGCRALNTEHVENDSTDQPNAIRVHEKTLEEILSKSPTGFQKSPSEHSPNLCERKQTKDHRSFQTDDSSKGLHKGRNQINFNMPESALSQTNSVKTKIHWNNVQPGRVTPAHVPVITIDRNRLM